MTTDNPTQSTDAATGSAATSPNSFDFDRVIARDKTFCMKYDPEARGKPAGVLPMWVADMDLQAPPAVLAALKEQAQHGIFGYFNTGDDYFAVLQDWFARRHNWQVQQDWLVTTPGVVNAIHVSILAYTQAGDGILIQQPVYYPFKMAVDATGRKLVVNELVEKDGHYSIDFDDFEKKIVEGGVKAFILCNPHNPVGRVFTKEELLKMGDICLRHGVVVISDEIHQEFIFEGHKHLVFADLSPQLADITITCTAPTKAFNLASLPVANIFITNPKLRTAFIDEYNKFGVSQIGVMEIAACMAAYGKSEDWLNALTAYLAENMRTVDDFLQAQMPEVKLIQPEGTYLAWLDFRALGLTDDELDAKITHQGNLWLHKGSTFGPSGSGFMRMNIACPHPTLERALNQLRQAFD